MKHKPTLSLTIENKGSLITIANSNDCLGYLMPFPGHGVYDAQYGRVDVTPDEAEMHNIYLSEAQIKGLDENCQVGQHGEFYFDRNKHVVHTFSGVQVANAVNYIPGGKVVNFERKGKHFRGMLHSNEDYFTFKRIS
jgi:hypothetical protein